MVKNFNVLASFLFIKVASFIYVDSINYKTYLVYFILALFARIEYSFFSTYIVIFLYLFTIFFYFMFFALVFKNDAFKKSSCEYLKQHLSPALFDSRVGNMPWHQFSTLIGGASLKVLAKANVGHLVVAGTGIVAADHAYHESGLKTVIDTKAYLIGEQMKYNFAVKNNVVYTPGTLPEKTISMLKTFVTDHPLDIKGTKT